MPDRIASRGSFSFAAENRDVRRLACEMLARIDTPESTEVLARWAVFETDPAIRAAAVDALRPRARHNAGQHLLRYVHYPWPRAAEHAAEAIVALDCKELIPQLAALLEQPDPDAPFRLFAPPPAPEPFAPSPAAPKPDPNAAEAAAVVARAALHAADEAALDTHARFARASDSAQRRKVAKNFAPFLTHADVSLRRRAAEVLAELGEDAEPVAPALREATKDPDPVVQTLARRALDRLDAVTAANRLAKLRAALAPLVKELAAPQPENRIKALYRIAEFGPDADLSGSRTSS